MSRPKRTKPSTSKSKAASPSASPTAKSAIRGWKLWCFRLFAIFGTPVILLALLEGGLRLAGYGYPTSFLQPASNHGQSTLVQNTRFGWRFFGPRLARVPAACSIPQIKPPGTVRIFVFGESAAFGDPQPQFGLPRMLEALLGLRHPGVKFEIVNAAMTAINSNVILPIARDCAGADGDLWVIYMGNNEVVGPFGAGTVFGPRAPGLALIRGSLAFKSTRTGEALASLLQSLQKPAFTNDDWGGMTMFLDHQLRVDDPRMETVYHHFEHNLADIIETGHRAGVGVVVSTVAVNLKDCAPFGSTNRSGISDGDKLKWEQLYQAGITAQNAQNLQEAEARFREAAQIDGTHAELQFRLGECALALKQTVDAQKYFRTARDFDTLRFRCDTRLNGITRKLASGREQQRILFADADHALSEQSPDGLPGEDLFYDHVHLTFDGNYRVATLIAAQIEKLLPATVTQLSTNQSWPSEADCAARLAWNAFVQQAAWAEVLSRYNRPPFIGQLNHDAQIQRLSALTQKFSVATQPSELSESRKSCEHAVATASDDPLLWEQLSSLQQMTGDLAGAATSARREVDLLPTRFEGWFELGIILARQQQFEEAVAAFRQAFALDTHEVATLENLGHALAKLGRRDEAVREYRRAVTLKPHFGPAWLELGELLEEMDRKSEAEDCYREALANRIPRAAELAALARFCQSRGWLEAAVTNYADAIRLNPADAQLHFETAQTLTALNKRDEATSQYAEAARLAPELGPAHFHHGVELGREGKAAEAVKEFNDAVLLMPDLLEAKLNLGSALVNDGHPAEALTQFEAVLQRNPTNAMALRAVQDLRAKLGASAPPAHP